MDAQALCRRPSLPPSAIAHYNAFDAKLPEMLRGTEIEHHARKWELLVRVPSQGAAVLTEHLGEVRELSADFSEQQLAIIAAHKSKVVTRHSKGLARFAHKSSTFAPRVATCRHLDLDKGNNH